MDPATSSIRVGLVGYGFAGKTFHAPLLRAEPRLRVTRVASRDCAKVHADLPDVGVDDRPLDLVQHDDVDLVVIATPNDSHAPLARAALLAGKNVVVDKPFTLDLKEARELASVAAGQGQLLSVFQNRRWDSDFLSVRQAMASGLVGDVLHFESHLDRYRPEVQKRWREGDGPGGGLWVDLGPHLVDQALCLFGLPHRVRGDLVRQRAGALANDWAHVVLDYGARRVILHATMLAAGGSSRFIVHGEAGSIVKRKADGQEAQILSGIRPGDPGWGEDPDPLLVYDASGRAREIPAVAGDQRRYYAQVAEALTGAGPNPVPPHQALAVMAVIEAAIKSSDLAAAVPLDLTDEERAAWG